jgi:flavin reductase (DIM6/NTAB) family NADH-FMN oxidoreductase RutF
MLRFALRAARSRDAMHYGTSSEDGTRHRLRALFREVAQPVAVVTSFMPAGYGHTYHGATLSSFTSIAMDPYPLVTFALRTPSRMAMSLKSHQPSHMVINILSAAQASTAIAFSRPDLHHDPFSSTPFSLNQEGLPMLEGSLGVLSCDLLSTSLPLHDLEFLQKQRGRAAEKESLSEGDCVVSELFIARVTRVEKFPTMGGDDQSLRTLPLLYHRRGFTSCTVPNGSESD